MSRNTPVAAGRDQDGVYFRAKYTRPGRDRG